MVRRLTARQMSEKTSVRHQPVHCRLLDMVRRLTARQISEKEQNSSSRRQPVHCHWLDMVRRSTARQISEKEQNSSSRRQHVRPPIGTALDGQTDSVKEMNPSGLHSIYSDRATTSTSTQSTKQ